MDSHSERDPGGPDTRHPIVAAALAAHGVTPQRVMADYRWGSGDNQSFLKDGLPVIGCGKRHISVLRRMPGKGDDVVFYVYEDNDDPRDAFWTTRLEFRNWMPPETMMAILPGRTVDQLVDIPGGEGIRILKACEMGRGLVLTLEPFEAVAAAA